MSKPLGEYVILSQSTRTIHRMRFIFNSTKIKNRSPKSTLQKVKRSSPHCAYVCTRVLESMHNTYTQKFIILEYRKIHFYLYIRLYKELLHIIKENTKTRMDRGHAQAFRRRGKQGWECAREKRLGLLAAKARFPSTRQAERKKSCSTRRQGRKVRRLREFTAATAGGTRCGILTNLKICPPRNEPVRPGAESWRLQRGGGAVLKLEPSRQPSGLVLWFTGSCLPGQQPAVLPHTSVGRQISLSLCTMILISLEGTAHKIFIEYLWKYLTWKQPQDQ